jgi:hypothetical protein
MPVADGSHTNYDLSKAWLLSFCFVFPVLPILANEVKKAFMRREKINSLNIQ